MRKLVKVLRAVLASAFTKPLSGAGALLVILAVVLVAAAVFVVVVRNDFEHAIGWEIRANNAASVGRDLINTTNSRNLDGISAEFKRDLASILGWPAWLTGDYSPPREPKGVVRLVIANERGEALHVRLQDVRSGRFRLLSYRKTTGYLSKEDRAFFSVAGDLIETTNSSMLDGTTAEFTADLASILAWPAWRSLGGSAPGDPRGVVRISIGNHNGQALNMTLQEDAESRRFRLLSYRKIPEPGGPANGSQPIRSETNGTSAAAGSRR
jgi:hypothetical protein